jgi:peroxiredoxin
MALRVGDPAPVIELVDDRGATWSSVRHDGRPLVLILHRHFY